eukprot:CAMPEP_0118725460 /NCGR_PEP_ID=MMETSP0800-20121206/33151_1 /TAXON_ID=210618 ORGANISM="Striatella unipunctata, Strain CCMP2910" /NCGR_SAMPLE_ID=MMETSP0800 /ASSEMBLY_ACC=CAM_ASM_000638 /LENGTH=122 /DNA_ID=CAMNT_0006634159 /DNA_START=138 /DNA_END=506 /DNA_ORIENTATION=-
MPAFVPFEYQERISILKGHPALCSARRWQRHGVLHVTYTNYRLVNLNERGMDPDQMYMTYYGMPPPKRKTLLSPWEVELQEILNKNLLLMGEVNTHTVTPPGKNNNKTHRLVEGQRRDTLFD